MRNLSKKLALALAIISSAFYFELSATHLVGGQIEYRWLTGNSFEITLYCYRDCGPGTALMPTSVEICSFDKVTNAPGPKWTIQRDSVVPVALGDQCYTPPGLCLETGYFSDSVVIPNNPNGYYLVYALAARNNAIFNLNNPGSQNMFWYTEMPDPALHNSSPSFVNYPRAYFCHSFPNFEDLSATDIDGDSLAYSMEIPKNDNACKAKPGGGYTPVTYKAGHSFTLPLGPGSTVSMDANSGTMAVTPADTTVNRLYVLALRVEEYRNGVKIGEIQRDIQYKVLTCNPNVPPYFTYEPNFNQYTIAAGEELCFDVNLSDVNDAWGSQPADGVYFTYSSELLNSDQGPQISISPTPADSVAAPDTAKIQVCIKTSCSDVRPQPYRVTIEGNDTSCYGVNTITYDLDVLVVIPGIVDLYPNVFTPNGDGKNDVFRTNALPSYCFDEFDVKIFNRWGNLIYESSNFDFEWDGNNKNGKPLGDGVYYYTLKSKFQDSENEEKGFVHLVR